MLDHVDEAKRREALGLVREGRMYDLGRVLDETVPGVPRALLPPDARHHRPPRQRRRRRGRTASTGSPSRSSGTQQLGTHLDALSHLQIGDRGYNGWTRRRARRARPACARLGVETVPQIVTRGWLVDAARRVDVIGARRTSTGIEPAPGDAVLFHTGWGAHWDDPERYLVGRAGPGLRGRATGSPSAASRSPAATPGATARCRPRTRRGRSRCRRSSTSRHGVFIVENLDLSALAADGVREFALILTHPKLRGATGAWTSPIALV